MRNRTWAGWPCLLLLGVLGAVVGVPGAGALAQTPPATTRLTIVVRDAAGQPLRTTRVEVYLPQPPALLRVGINKSSET